MDLAGLLADLDAESADLDAVLAAVPPGELPGIATPAPGWSVAHQIAHLAWTDEQALLAVREPEAAAAAFAAALARPGALTIVDDAAAAGVAGEPAELLVRWRAGRAELQAALAAAPEGARIPWFGPPMSAASMTTARLMETWAHGHDVADALGVTRAPTARLRHVAHIGVRARDFAYRVRGRTPPAAAFRVELTGPAGEAWAWGPEPASPSLRVARHDTASDLVRGPALDFCLLVTQRRHRADLALEVWGADADAWLDIAQAFAGPPGAGRAAGAFA